MNAKLPKSTLHSSNCYPLLSLNIQGWSQKKKGSRLSSWSRLPSNRYRAFCLRDLRISYILHPLSHPHGESISNFLWCPWSSWVWAHRWPTGCWLYLSPSLSLPVTAAWYSNIQIRNVYFDCDVRSYPYCLCWSKWQLFSVLQVSGRSRRSSGNTFVDFRGVSSCIFLVDIALDSLSCI